MNPRLTQPRRLRHFSSNDVQLRRLIVYRQSDLSKVLITREICRRSNELDLSFSAEAWRSITRNPGSRRDRSYQHFSKVGFAYPHKS
jgi:hypothetical protein